MISHKHKFIFVHVPKCGGTSIEHSLLKNENVTKITNDVKQKYRMYYYHEGIQTQHRKIDQFKDAREKSYFTFTFVRNPWERFLSEYFYIKKTGCKCKHRDFNKKFPTFKHFVKNNGIECCWPTTFHKLTLYSMPTKINLRTSLVVVKICNMILIMYVAKLEYPKLNCHIEIQQNTNTTPNTTMKKQKKSLRKNTQKTLSILVISLENKNENIIKFIYFLITLQEIISMLVSTHGLKSVIHNNWSS